ncbi:MAG TPA: zinc-dependent metalloprotease [Acidimicrobiales bacterium]|nr:zinc-dependent metalloprotease [Acidimicrobiales bacterium]
MSQDDPFGGIPFFGDLSKLVGRQGPVAWEPATQLALAIATEGVPESNVDPLERIRLEQLARVAEVQINGATGLSVVTGGQPVTIEPVNRSTWVLRTIEAYKPRFEALARQLTDDDSATSGGSGDAPDAPRPAASGHPAHGNDEPPVAGLEDLVGLGDELGQFDTPPADDRPVDRRSAEIESDDFDDGVESWLSGMLTMLSPMLLGMTAGSLVGHLSRHNFGTYDLPLPRPAGAPIMVLPAVIDSFATEWDLDGDGVRLAICLHELASHAVLGTPHVRAALDGLLADYAAGFHPDPDALERHLGEIDPTNPEALASFQRILGDPEIIVGATAGPGQAQRRARISALVAVIVGYVDHVVNTVGARLIDGFPRVAEALLRRRVGESDADDFTSRLFGIELGQELLDRGRSFIDGVVERSGEEGPNRLWDSPDHLPTVAEVDAPGLWLARIDLDTLDD